MNNNTHDKGCIGFHTNDVTCQEAIDWRNKQTLNPWICWVSRNGYHGFVDSDSLCIYGCGTTFQSLVR